MHTIYKVVCVWFQIILGTREHGMSLIDSITTSSTAKTISKLLINLFKSFYTLQMLKTRLKLQVELTKMLFRFVELPY